MGDRSVVHMVQSGVRLYTHWGGSGLPEAVQAALRREARWGDHPYLARIIFDSMSQGQHGETSGFGIMSSTPGDVYRICHVDTNERTVRLEFDSLAGPENEQVEYSFEEFVNLENPEWP